MFDADKCPYSEVCQFYKDDFECNEGCIRYIEIMSLLETAKIPKYWYKPKNLIPESQDKKVFLKLKDYKDNVEKNVEEGNCLYIYSSNVGNGKTSWAIKIMMSYFDKIWAGNGGTPKGSFVPISKFINEIKDNITLKDDTVILAKDLYNQVDLLILDDIGTVAKTDYNLEQIFNIVDERYLNGKATIYTSNIPPNQLHTVLGKRLASRVLGRAEVLEIKGGDNRW